MHAGRPTLVALALATLSASAGLARPAELPPELRGRLAVEIARCRPIGGADALLEAELVVRSTAGAVDLPGLQCAAYDDAGEAYFLSPVAGRIALRARQVKRLTVRFAADASHRECGCRVPAAGARVAGEPRASRDSDPAFRALVEKLSREERAREPEPPAAPASVASDPPPVSSAAPDPSAADPAPVQPAFAPPALRYERLLAPRAPLRAEPSAHAAVTGVAAAGSRLAVDRIAGGWKLARTGDGLTGWLPSDASTADVAAPERLAEQLAPLRAALSPGADTSALCSSLERSALGELVAAWGERERAVYVRPLWHALAAEDRAAFRAWAAQCYGTRRVIDAATGRDVD